MKKSLFTLLMVITLSTAYSQTRVGFNIRYNYSTINNMIYGNQINPEPKSGVAVGVNLEQQFGKYFAIQPEIYYSQQGIKENYAWYETVPLNLNYLYFGLPVKLYPVPKIYLMSGVQYGLLLSAKRYSFTNGNPVAHTPNYNNDFSLIAGLGFNTSIGINLGARYNMGLNNVDKEPWSTGVRESNNIGPATNRVFQVFIGYSIKASKRDK